MYSSVLTEVLSTGKVYTSDGNACNLDLASVRWIVIDENEGHAIYDLIKNQQISVSLEVGCGYGISSLYICDALSANPSPHHTIIDPYQLSKFRGIGISNLQRAGCDFFTLIEKPSELALPELLAKGKKYEFVFIDGWHTFDHTLLDFFYADRLLDDGGFIAIDDAMLPGISKVVRYATRYPNYHIYKAVNVLATGPGVRQIVKRSLDLLLRTTARTLPKNYSAEVFTEQCRNPNLHTRGYGTMVILQKIGPDTRNSLWYRAF